MTDPARRTTGAPPAAAWTWTRLSRFAAPRTRVALLALACLAALLCPGTLRPAHADDVTGQKISRSEVIARAQYWVYKGPSYTQTGSYYPDPDGRGYRRDCSGFVSMAWHLGDDPDTAHFPGHSGVSKLSSRTDMQPGDMFDDVTDGHMVLFSNWEDSAHTKFTYYAFGGAHPKKATVSFSADDLDDSPMSHYTAYTYSKLFNDAAGATIETPASGGTCAHTPYFTVALTGMHDVDLATDECYKYSLDRAAGKYYLDAWLTVDWKPATGSGDSSDNTTHKFDGFEPHLQFQLDNSTSKEFRCSGFADRINDDFTNGDGVGDYVCAASIESPGSGAWTIDGWIEYDENSDGLSWQGPVYVDGSPALDL